MNYVGRWVFHSIGTFGDEGIEYHTAEEYMNSPMLYIDESDPEAVADEMKERRGMVKSEIRICEDGKMYMLMPIPEGATEAEINAAVEEGAITLYDGMMTDSPKAWEERDGELWLEVGEGMSEDGWVKLSDGEGYLLFMTTRYVKAE